MEANEVIFYNEVNKYIQTNTRVVVEYLCNGWTVINIGTTVAIVNGVPLNPGTPGTNNGESVSKGGNKGEFYKGLIEISFPATGAGNVIVIQKIYLPDTFTKNKS